VAAPTLPAGGREPGLPDPLIHRTCTTEHTPNLPAVNRKIWIAMLLAAFGWGTGGVATRSVLLHGVDPFTLISIRYLMSAFLLVGWLLWRRGLTANRGAWLAGLAIGIVNMSGPTVFFTLSLQHISAGLGGLLVTLVPIATAVWAHFLLADEPFSAKKLGGLLVAFAGVAVLIATGESGIVGGDPLVGVAWSGLGIGLASLGGVLSRTYTQRYSVAELAGPQFVVGAGAALIVAEVLGTTALGAIGTVSWGLLGYLATIGTVLPFIAFLWVVQKTTATHASLIGYLVPLVSLITGAVFLSERLTATIGVAAVLILVGVVMVDRTDTTRPVVP